MLYNNYTTYQCCQIHVICCLTIFICCTRIITLNMLCKKLDMLCKIRQHINCIVFFRCALGRACQVRRLQRSRRQEGNQQTAAEAVCAKVASSCPRKSELLSFSCCFSRHWAAQTECRCSAWQERAARQEGAAAKRSCVASSPHNQFWGSVIFRAIWWSWRCWATQVLSIHSGDVAKPSQSLASTQLHYDVENTK